MARCDSTRQETSWQKAVSAVSGEHVFVEDVTSVGECRAGKGSISSAANRSPNGDGTRDDWVGFVAVA